MKQFLSGLCGLFVILSCSPAFGSEWEDIVAAAAGQTVYFNAWGGSQPVNAYIEWAAGEVQKKYKIRLVHVKVTDIGDVVSRILIEKSAGKAAGGSVDLMWLNGENFKTMKENSLLYGPFSRKLPHYALADVKAKPNLLYDFTVPVDNLESPWGTAQLVFLYESRRVPEHPKSMPDLLAFLEKHPGKFTYPAIPEFHGTTFIKQALMELIEDPEVLNHPVNPADFEAQTRPLWDFLDRLHPLLWRNGKVFPAGASQMFSLLNDGEIYISLSFNPNAAANAVESGELPDTVRTYVHSSGTIGNAHFVAIPFNASAREGAMVFADFLLSPRAQAEKANPRIWGDPTVLDIQRLSPEDRALFEAIPKPAATLAPEELGRVLPEPHASWVQALEKAWLKKYNQ
jgi:putative thiamine transport system substrate-binding protein